MRKNTKQGISLIVLVITIIIMIILAAAIILSLSSNGIIGRANEAIENTDLAGVKALAALIWSEVYLENMEGANLNYATEVPKRLGEQIKDASKYNIEADGNGVTVTINNVPEEWQAYVSDVVDEVPIPKGFVASPYEGEKTKAEGLVIYELSSDDKSDDIATIDGSHQVSLEKRNQYVWVPVNKNTFETTFVRRDFTTENTTNTSVVNEEGKYYALGTTDKYWEVDPTTDETDDTNKNFIEISTIPPSTTIKEVQEMYASVKEYGGFYIARYEAGIGNELEDQRADEGNKEDLPTGLTQVHSKMGQIPYTYILWTWEEVMNQESYGAVSVSRSLYPNTSNNTTGVVSTLTYGVQWDTAVEWFRTSGKYGEGNTVTSVTSSIEYGNYSNHAILKGDLNLGAKYAIYENRVLGAYENVEYTNEESKVEKNTSTRWALSTGALKAAKVNNIYDMAGNMMEWTMEGYYSSGRIIRGGAFGYDGSTKPVSDRLIGLPNGSYNFSQSFRPSLYIKK